MQLWFYHVEKLASQRTILPRIFHIDWLEYTASSHQPLTRLVWLGPDYSLKDTKCSTIKLVKYLVQLLTVSLNLTMRFIIIKCMLSQIKLIHNFPEVIKSERTCGKTANALNEIWECKYQTGETQNLSLQQFHIYRSQYWKIVWDDKTKKQLAVLKTCCNLKETK